MLTPEQRRRVEAVLLAETVTEALAALELLESPQELHAAALEYNWDDGFAVPGAILEHALCERGTALHLFFAAQGPWSDPGGVSAPQGGFLARARERLLSEQLPERVVSYDPVMEWALERVQVLRLRQGGLPEELLRACGPR